MIALFDTIAEMEAFVGGQNVFGINLQEKRLYIYAKNRPGINIDSERVRATGDSNDRWLTTKQGKYVDKTSIVSFNNPRTPSAYNDTHIIATISQTANVGQAPQVDIVVGGITVGAAVFQNISVLGQSRHIVPCSFFVPAGDSYRLNSSGAGTNLLLGVFEMRM